MKSKPKKSLGQNFLINPKVAERIAMEANISKKDVVLEIGPGTGKLTRQLLATSCQLLAVEKDNNLYELLKTEFQKEISSGQLNLIHGDILDFDTTSYKLEASCYKLVANIPYNITGAILKKFLTAEHKPERMVLMVQKEVAERIVARDKKESLLSISVKAYGTPKILFKVSRGNFYPEPNVDSAVIAIKNILPLPRVWVPSRTRPLLKGEEKKFSEERFWEIVKAGFAHKRKKLSGNLKDLCQRDTLTDYADKRAEDLTLENWIALAKT